MFSLGDETVEERALRANTYALLAGLLAGPPSAELLRRLAALPPTAENGEPLSLGWCALGLAARGVDAETLKTEHQALFIGVTHGEVMPYASWYRTGFLMEKPLAELRSDLARLGYARQEGVREPEDHAAALCEVMAQLAAGADSRQAGFFSRHMAPWLPRLFQDMQAAQAAVFYRSVAAWAKAFMAFEAEYLDVK